MCGRFGLPQNWQKTSQFLWKQFQVELKEDSLILPQYNIAPTHRLITLIHDGTRFRVGLSSWGFPLSNQTTKVVINARSESVFEKTMFRQAMKTRRCLILGGGFYEWKRDEKPSRVFWFQHQTQPWMVFAGLYQVTRDDQGKSHVYTSMLTTHANETMKPIHDRIPVMLNPDQYRHWVDPKTAIDELAFLLKPDNYKGLSFYEVSSHVNQVKHNDALCLEAIKK
ncbi:MAG: SOS response-associated peptidase [Firmicutes bacterium]|nr:SOS response-associated peptidase [Bacillota bacterium]